MTRLIALSNQKGGVGKTTTAINLGASLAELGQRVLIVDMDPQGNATDGLGLSKTEGLNTYDLIMNETPLAEVVRETRYERLSVVPSTSELAGAEVELTSKMAREFRLMRALNGATDDYDFVLIDCPPSVGLLTVNALAAANEVIIPVQTEYLALEGLGQFTKTLDLVRRNLNAGLKIRGVVLTMFDRRTGLAKQVAEEVRKHFPNTFHTVIPRSVRLSEAPSHGQPINSYDPGSTAAQAYLSLAEEVLEPVGRTSTLEVAP